MQTYTHVVMTALYTRLHRRREAAGYAIDSWPPLDSTGAIAGSFAPDTPLILLTMGFIAWDMAEQRGLDMRSDEGRANSHTGRLFSDLFFNAHWVKAVHNLFHAPLLVGMYTLLGYLGWLRGREWGARLFWFGLACTAHTAIDIPLHYDDGPLLFFPFDFETRFRSPVSYWDPKRHGRIFVRIEHVLLVFLLLFLFYLWMMD